MEGRTSSPQAAGAHPDQTPPVPQRPAEREESSGLHEIRELARTTKRRITRRQAPASEAQELLWTASSALSAVALPKSAAQPPLASPPLAQGTRQQPAQVVPAAAPAVQGERSRGAGLWIGAGLAAVAIAGAVGFALLRKGGPGSAATAAAAPAAAKVAGITPPAEAGKPTAVPLAAEAEPAARAATSEPARAAATSAPGATEPRAAAASGATETRDSARAAAASAPGATESHARRRARARAAESGAPETPETARRATETRARAERPARRRGASAPGAEDELDALLSSVTGGVEHQAEATAAAPAEPKRPRKSRLERADVKRAMAAVRNQAQACYEVEEVTGTVMVKFRVAPSGAVQSPKATGSHAGTATGRCVAEAVAGARFPAFDGAPTSFSYPFLLTP